MIRVWDYFYWALEKCLVRLQDIYIRKDEASIIMLQAIAKYNLWLWHAFLRARDFNNNISILLKSLLI
jgi:hypothetical protein